MHQTKKWFDNSTFGQTARRLWENGFSFDYISDRQIAKLLTDNANNVFITEASKYKTIVVPAIDYIPQATLKKFESLAQSGVKIIFAEKFSAHYPGLLAHKANQVISENKYFILSENLSDDLKKINVRQETLSKYDLSFIRKKNNQGYLYFITNFESKAFEDTIRLSCNYNFITVIDPLTNKSY